MNTSNSVSSFGELPFELEREIEAKLENDDAQFNTLKIFRTEEHTAQISEKLNDDTCLPTRNA